jgi:hypothetical protein
MADSLGVEGRRLALAATLRRHAGRVGEAPADEAGLLAAVRALECLTHPRVRFDPAYPGVTAGPERAGERLRLVLACRAHDENGELGTVFTTLIAGRKPTVSVAPPGAPIDTDWK